MHIFIDESKNFLIPSQVKCAVSCVSCLVIPDEDYQAISNAFEALKADWGVSHTEVKGKDLDEQRIDSVVRMLNRYDVIFETVAIEMALETECGILNHKNAQANKLMEKITPAHLPSLVESIKEAQKKFVDMPNQLYVQTVLMVRLVANILQKASLYYAQRKPKELGRFYWVVDAKDKTMTPYEEFWKSITLPFLQTITLREPIILLNGADYTSFMPFYGEMARAPEHLLEAVGEDSPFAYMEINKIMKDLSFKNSERENGLQLVDILCNAIQRAMNGNLQPPRVGAYWLLNSECRAGKACHSFDQSELGVSVGDKGGNSSLYQGCQTRRSISKTDDPQAHLARCGPLIKSLSEVPLQGPQQEQLSAKGKNSRWRTPPWITVCMVFWHHQEAEKEATKRRCLTPVHHKKISNGDIHLAKDRFTNMLKWPVLVKAVSHSHGNLTRRSSVCRLTRSGYPAP
jgi:hypothetical protein